MLETGTVFGSRYEIIKSLGSGAAGAVYLACDRSRRSFLVAIKILYPHCFSSQNALIRFRNEIMAAYRIDHPNVVRAYEYFDENQFQAYAMEYVDGGDLLTRMTRQRLTIAGAINYLRQMAAGLGAIHAQNIIHRDLKPANLLLTQDGVIKISDFGVARVSGSASITSTGSTVGTPKYLSPEYIQTGDCDHRSDIYALGVIGFEMVAGIAPFKAETPVSLVVERFKQTYPSLLKVCPECPPELARIIEKAMSFDLNKRYQAASHLLHDLENFAMTLEPRTPDILSTPQQKPVSVTRTGSTPHPTTYHQQTSSAIRNFTRSTSAIILRNVSTPKSIKIIFAAAMLSLVAFNGYLWYDRRANKIPSNPLEIYGIAAAFNADNIKVVNNSNIVAWQNSTAQDLTAVQLNPNNQPKLIENALNGHSVLSFDGRDDFMVIDGIFSAAADSSSMTIAYVARSRTDNYQSVWSLNNQTNGSSQLFAGTESNNNLFLSMQGDDNSAVRLTMRPANFSSHNFSIYIVSIEDGDVKVFVNGNKALEGTLNINTNLNSLQSLTIASANHKNQASSNFNGELAEMILYSRAISKWQRKGVENYLSQKYLLPLTRPD